MTDYGPATGRPRIFFLLLSLALCLIAIPASAAKVYFISPGGDDSNDGSFGQPFESIQHAADVVDPGDTVIIRDGVYTSNDEAVVFVSRSGTADNWITFKAEHDWSAILDGQDFRIGNGILLEQGVAYVRIEGLQIQNTIGGGISADEDTHDIYYYRNLIHHIGRICTERSGGLVGFRDKSSSSRMVYDGNVLHTIGRLTQAEGCNATLNNDGNHDHGLYLHGRDIVIINNVFYNFQRGWAIQSSEGASGWVIAQNTFAFPNPDRQGQITLWEGNTNFAIANNIFYEPNGAAIFLDPCRTKTNVTVENNITTADLLHDDETGESHCARLTLADNQTYTDPKLADPEHFDFRLTEHSPAIDGAAAELSPSTDQEGAVRPRGEASDIGAFEFKPTPPRERLPPRARSATRQ